MGYAVPFTQYLLPDGRKIEISFNRPKEVYDKAIAIMIDSMSDKEFKDYLEKSGFVVKEVNVNNIEEERELDEISKEVLCLREALKHACDVFAYHTGSCPYDKYDSCQLPGSCEDQYSECWQEYFISKIKPPGERTDSK